MATSVLTDNSATTGEINITWTDAEEPADFYSWRLYQRSDSDDPWVLIYETFTSSASFDVDVYGWANGVTQEIILVGVSQDAGDGSLTETAYTGANSFTPTGDQKYTLVHPTDPSFTVKFNLVTSHGYKSEGEHTVMRLMGDDEGFGGGYKINRGVGFSQVGSFDATIHDHPVLGTATAQAKALGALQRLGVEVFLRDPFGGLLKIGIGDLDFTRVPGVGTMGSVDVTIPYTEVF